MGERGAGGHRLGWGGLLGGRSPCWDRVCGVLWGLHIGLPFNIFVRTHSISVTICVVYLLYIFAVPSSRQGGVGKAVN